MMREPYRTFFEGYEDHWLLGRYLTGDEPDWRALADEDRLVSLSTGEKVLLDFAAAYANVLIYLDEDHLYRVGQALKRVTCDG